MFTGEGVERGCVREGLVLLYKRFFDVMGELGGDGKWCVWEIFVTRASQRVTNYRENSKVCVIANSPEASDAI